MKKYLKIFVITLAILITGCGNSDLKNYYKNMTFKKIDSYILDLRINGEYKNRNINEIIRIYNYKNEQLKIVNSPDIDKIYEKNDENLYTTKSIIFEKNNVYLQTDEHKYEKSDKTLVYKETEVYLKSIESVEKIIKSSKEKIADKEYKVYEVEFKKNAAQEIINNTNYKDLKVTNEVIGKVYIDNDYVYKIEMKIEKLNLTISYFGINSVNKTNLEM